MIKLCARRVAFRPRATTYQPFSSMAVKLATTMANRVRPVGFALLIILRRQLRKVFCFIFENIELSKSLDQVKLAQLAQGLNQVEENCF